MKENTDFYFQKRDLISSKALFPEYKAIHSQVLQDYVKQAKNALGRWIKGDCNVKKSGKPRFKRVGRYRSFTFPHMKRDCIQGKFIDLSMIGNVKLIQHRSLPDGFKIKTATFHCKTAQKFLQQGKNASHEKLTIKGLAKSRLAKSINDAG